MAGDEASMPINHPMSQQCFNVFLTPELLNGLASHEINVLDAVTDKKNQAQFRV
jgi:hypothetical protein